MENTLTNMISDLKSLYNFQQKKINDIDVLKQEHFETQDLLFEQIKSLQLKVDEVTQEYVEKVNEFKQEYVEKVNELKQKYDTLKHKSEIDYETLKKEKENEVIQLKQQEQVTYNEMIGYIKNLQMEVNELKEQNKNNQLELSKTNKEHIITALKIISNKVNINAQTIRHGSIHGEQHFIINKDTEEDINMIDRIYGKYLFKNEYKIKISRLGLYSTAKCENDEIVYQLFNKKISIDDISDFYTITRQFYTLIFEFNKTYNNKFMFISSPSPSDFPLNYKLFVYEFIN